MAGAFGLLSLLAGTIAGFAAIAMPTTVNGVHNVGLLTRQVCLAIASSTCYIVAAVLLAAEYISSSRRAR